MKLGTHKETSVEVAFRIVPKFILESGVEDGEDARSVCEAFKGMSQ